MVTGTTGASAAAPNVLETRVQQLLALTAHEVPTRCWRRFWR
jgi:hypothetical protein